MRVVAKVVSRSRGGESPCPSGKSRGFGVRLNSCSGSLLLGRDQQFTVARDAAFTQLYHVAHDYGEDARPDAFYDVVVDTATIAHACVFTYD